MTHFNPILVFLSQITQSALLRQIAYPPGSSFFLAQTRQKVSTPKRSCKYGVTLHLYRYVA